MLTNIFVVIALGVGIFFVFAITGFLVFSPRKAIPPDPNKEDEYGRLPGESKRAMRERHRQERIEKNGWEPPDPEDDHRP